MAVYRLFPTHKVPDKTPGKNVFKNTRLIIDRAAEWSAPVGSKPAEAHNPSTPLRARG